MVRTAEFPLPRQRALAPGYSIPVEHPISSSPRASTLQEPVLWLKPPIGEVSHKQAACRRSLFARRSIAVCSNSEKTCDVHAAGPHPNRSVAELDWYCPAESGRGTVVSQVRLEPDNSSCRVEGPAADAELASSDSYHAEQRLTTIGRCTARLFAGAVYSCSASLRSQLEPVPDNLNLCSSSGSRES